MSWVNITTETNNNELKIKNDLKIKNELKIKNDLKIKNELKGYKSSLDENFETFVGSDLFDEVIYSLENCQKYNRPLFAKCSSTEIYNFFKKFIIMEQFEENSETESDGEFIEDY